MKIILAVNKLGYIGKEGKLPWRSSGDLAFFKQQTLGKRLLVGRITYENMPKLKDREMIVVGKGHYSLKEGVDKKPDFIIGGKMLIESVLNIKEYRDKIDEILLSIITDDTKGDVMIPQFSNYGIKITHRIFTTD